MTCHTYVMSKYDSLRVLQLMFYYQFSNSISKWRDPPVVEVSEDLRINYVELPMITVCPTEQFNLSVLENYGFKSYDFFIRGLILTNKAGNKTFWEIVNEALLYSLEHDVDIESEKDNVWNQTFLPKYGFCWNLVNYSYSNVIIVKTKTLIKKTGPMVIFLTDKNLRTDFDLHLASHRGENILMEIGKSSTHYVEVEKLSYFDPKNETACKSYAAMEYAKCVDNDKLDSTIRICYECNPPWLNLGDRCTNMNWTKKLPPNNNSVLLIHYGIFKTVLDSHINPIIEMENIDAKRACPTPCTVLVSKIRNGNSKNEDKSEIRLLFNDFVTYSHNVINYHFTDFLVDIGSSVGLWFGLSVFGLADLGIQISGYLRVCCGFGSK